MTIKKLILENYIMFGVNNITRLEYTPDKGMNTILGGNGAGKSKLLSELTPLPINKKHYKDGYKLITIEHNNSTYTLYSGNNKQSFKVDGVELNTNGLITTQTKLAKEHFYIDSDVRDLNLSVVKFTDMTIAERKKWFTRISTTDYKFSINLFNKLKGLSRDLKGSVKLLNIKNITVDNELLNSMKSNLADLKIKRDKLSSMVNSNISIDKDPEFEYLPDIDIILNNLETLTTTEYTEEQITSIIEVKNKDIEKLTLKIKDLTIEDDTSLEALQDSIKQLKVNIKALEDNTHLVIRNDIFTHMFEIRTDLLTLFDTITYTPMDFQEIDERRNALLVKNKVLRERLLILEENRLAIEDSGESTDVECPSCKYTWSVGFNKKEHDKLLTKIANTNKELEEVVTNIDVIDKKHNDARLSIDAIADLRLLISGIHDDSVREVLYSSMGVDGYIMEINQLYVSIENSITIFTFNQDLKTLEGKLLTQKLLNKEDIRRVKEETASLENDLGNMYTDVTKLRELHKEIITFNKQKESIQYYKDKLNKDIDKFKDNTDNLLLVIINKLVLDTINVLDVRIDTLTNNINRAENDKSILAFTNKKIEEEKRRIEVVEDLIHELSPDGGIIAESLSNFMHIFIEDMNKIIEAIWRYELKVLPCTVDDGDLDYIFKVWIPNNTLKDTVEDIRELSTGQAEIVDFAFKLTTFNYLRILETPIMLDEVFVNLEIKHKELAFKYLDELVESYTIEQAFMISHRDESHTTIDDNTIFLDGVSTSKRLKIKRGEVK